MKKAPAKKAVAKKAPVKKAAPAKKAVAKKAPVKKAPAKKAPAKKARRSARRFTAPAPSPDPPSNDGGSGRVRERRSPRSPSSAPCRSTSRCPRCRSRGPELVTRLWGTSTVTPASSTTRTASGSVAATRDDAGRRTRSRIARVCRPSPRPRACSRASTGVDVATGRFESARSGSMSTRSTAPASTCAARDPTPNRGSIGSPSVGEPHGRPIAVCVCEEGGVVAIGRREDGRQRSAAVRQGRSDTITATPPVPDAVLGSVARCCIDSGKPHVRDDGAPAADARVRHLGVRGGDEDLGDCTRTH